MTPALPAAVGVYVELHWAVPTGFVPWARVQVVKPPATVEVRVTVPPGVVGPVLESTTVTVQPEPWFTRTGLVQVMLVIVG